MRNFGTSGEGFDIDRPHGVRNLYNALLHHPFLPSLHQLSLLLLFQSQPSVPTYHSPTTNNHALFTLLRSPQPPPPHNRSPLTPRSQLQRQYPLQR